MKIKKKQTVLPKEKTQWDVVAFYVITFLMSLYVGDHIWEDVESLFNNDNIKTNYKVEVTSNDSIKVYSTSSDTVYNGTKEEFHEIVHIDNL